MKDIIVFHFISFNFYSKITFVVFVCIIIIFAVSARAAIQ